MNEKSLIKNILYWKDRKINIKNINYELFIRIYKNFLEYFHVLLFFVYKFLNFY